MHIATWNVARVTPRSWRRLPFVLDALADRGQELLVLTEAHLAVAPAPRMRLCGQSASAPDRPADERWVCIWVRESIPAQPLELHGDPQRSAAVLLEPPHSPPAVVMGTVLPWRGDVRYAHLRGYAAFRDSLERQSGDLERLRRQHPAARCWLLGDFNQELDADGPVGTTRGRQALLRFLDQFQLLPMTAGPRDPLRARGWRASIDHICLDPASAAQASPPRIWPELFPLPRSTYPDHHGVELTIAPG